MDRNGHVKYQQLMQAWACTAHVFYKLQAQTQSKQSRLICRAAPHQIKKNWSQTYIFESSFAFIVPVDKEIQKADAVSSFENQAAFSSLSIFIKLVIHFSQIYSLQ